MKYDEFSTSSVCLKEITWDASPIVESPFAQLSPNLRLYHMGDPAINSFSFCCVKFCLANGEYEDVWDDPDVEVDVLCAGYALFDGIRHLYMPYWHYASCQEGIKLFVALHNLQLHYNVEDA